MIVIRIVILLMPLVEMINSVRLFPYPLRPGESRIALSSNMFKKTKETKEDLENYLYDNAPYRKYNRAGRIEKPKKTRDDLDQYLYEKYNDLRRSYHTKKEQKSLEDQKYLYNNAPYRKSLQQFRSLPVVIILKRDNLESDEDTTYLRVELKSKKFDNFDRIAFNGEKKNLNNKLKFLKTDENVEAVNKKVLRLGKEGNLQCVAFKTRRKQINYDSTSESSSKEFHSGEKRQFKLWREHYVCGNKTMPKYVPEPDDLTLRPLKYKSTNRLLNDMLKEKIWRPGNPLKMRLPQKVYKGLNPPIRKTDVNQIFVPRTEFELSELVI